MGSEIRVIPGADRELTVGEWQDAAAALVARLAPDARLELDVWFWRPGPTLLAGRSAVIVNERNASIRVAGAPHGGVHLVVSGALADLGAPDDPEARFIREHGCEWELIMATVPYSPERDRLLSVVLGISAGHLFSGLILNGGHAMVPLDTGSASEWEAYLSSALAREGHRPVDFESLALWYARLIP